MRWYSDRPLRFKLLASFGFVLLLMLGGGSFSAYGLRNTTAAYASLISDMVATRSQAQAINTAFITRHKVLKDAYLFNTDSQKVQSTESQVGDLDAQVVDGLGQLANNPVLTTDEKQLVQQAQAAYTDYEKASAAAIAKVKESGDPYTTQQAAAALTSGQDKPVSAALDALQASISGRAAQEQDRVQAQAERTVPVTLAVLLAALGLGLVIALALATALARSVREVAAVARHIASADLPSLVSSAAALARGDLTQSATITATPLVVRGRDEVGAMAADFNRMIEGLHQSGTAFAEMIDNLRELVGHVQQSSNSLADASQQLGSAASSTGVAVQQVNLAIQNIALGAQDTSRGAQNTTSAVGQLGTSIAAIARGAADQAAQAQAASAAAVRMATDLEEVATSASGVAAASQQARSSAEHGADAVREAENGMTEIRAVVTEAGSRVRQLGSLSEKIGAVVETIDDIAEQTNLLALNSAIEAARAGEHGRGFAVVADEVRKLAERSSRETKAISELIRQVQSGTLEAVAAMDSGAAKVELGASKAGLAAQALEEIVQAVEVTVHKTTGIASSSQEMAVAARGVTEAMQSISAIVEENTAATEEMASQSDQVSEAIRGIASVAEEQSAGTEQVSRAAEEMSAQAEEMSAQAEEVAATAEQLKVLVSRFRLGQQPAQGSNVLPLKRAA